VAVTSIRLDMQTHRHVSTDRSGVQISSSARLFRLYIPSFSRFFIQSFDSVQLRHGTKSILCHIKKKTSTLHRVKKEKDPPAS
jgi:hypothetical protein